MRRRALIMAGAGLVAGAALALGIDARHDARSDAAVEAARLAREAGREPARTVPASEGAITLSFAPVARKVQPAVVNIYTARVIRGPGSLSPFFSIFNGQPRVANALGSGVIVDARGLVITNNHVAGNADQIIVALADRREYPAKLLFADAKLDLALLKIDPGKDRLPVASLGDSDRAQVGDLVLAIGNPFGVGQTVTQGIVSALARTGIGVSDAQFFVQTDAAINQGNSGGALVNMAGEVIGINTAILTGSDGGGSIGLGFAVPSNMVRVFLQGAGSGRLVTAWIGAAGEPVTAESARESGLDRPTGVLVTEISPGSPAAAAGLAAGDIIYAIDGKEVTDPSALRYRIATQPVGSRVTLTVIRAGRPRNLALTLAAPPETPPRQLTRLPAGTILAGIAIANLSPALAQELGAGLPEKGVVVVEVPGGTPAAATGVPRPGDIIEQINEAPVRTVGDVQQALARSPSRTLFRIDRNGQDIACLFEAPAGFGCRVAR